jgi:hypothetical protein
MIDRDAEGDAAASLLERRWFASNSAVRDMQTECEILRDVMEVAAEAWRLACDDETWREVAAVCFT